MAIPNHYYSTQCAQACRINISVYANGAINSNLPPETLLHFLTADRKATAAY
jgi:hypothetical protein